MHAGMGVLARSHFFMQLPPFYSFFATAFFNPLPDATCASCQQAVL